GSSWLAPTARTTCASAWRSRHAATSVVDAAGNGASLKVAVTIAARLPNDRAQPRERSEDEFAQIVTVYVLDDVATRLDEASVGRRELNPDQQIPGRAVRVRQG